MNYNLYYQNKKIQMKFEVLAKIQQVLVGVQQLMLALKSTLGTPQLHTVMVGVLVHGVALKVGA